MKIYISGQITGLEFKEAELNFAKVYFNFVTFENLKSYNIVNPLNLNPLFGIKKWLCYMITDIRKLRTCTHIAMQPNWINSRGAVIEYFCAKFIFKLQIIWL